jgi:ABC-type lipoprotein export system ATPase subunit
VQYKSTRYQDFEFQFQRINVMLGANGSGKSKLLSEIKDKSATFIGSSVAYIEGGRTIHINDALQIHSGLANQYDSLESATLTHRGKRAGALAQRVFDALMFLEKKGAFLKAEHSDKVDEWLRAGQLGECPHRSKPPLDRLFELFNELFHQIELSFNSENKRLLASKNGVSYSPSGLSDGEKQAFSILADLIELDDDHKLIVADEPELNLHPELAERLWTLIENEFPDKVFIYATHSIGFALRRNVEKIWILSSDSRNIINFEGMGSLPRADTAAFLGGLPGILSANRVVVTEGHEKSFDAIFYRWILQDNSIEIYPGGGCSDVVSIINKSGLWSHISTQIRFAGIIDSDFRDDTYIASLQSQGVSALNYHEAEGYICIPEIICAVAERIGSQEQMLTQESVKDLIFSKLSESKLSIAARRTFARLHLKLGVSVDRKTLAKVASRDALISLVKDAATDELDKAHAKLSPTEIEDALDAEIQEVESIIARRDIDLALKLLPSKELLNSLAPRAGCGNASSLMRSLRNNFKPDQFPATKILAEQIRSKFD